MIQSTTVELDLIQSLDLSVFSFGENIDDFSSPVNAPGASIQEAAAASFPFTVNANYAVPVSDDDESFAGSSFFTDMRFHPLDENEAKETHRQDGPSMEEMVAKLNRSMLRSARSRAIVSKTIFPDLTKKGHENAAKKSNKKAKVHKAERKPIKSSFHSNTQSSLTLDGGQKDNSICGFLRASKRW